jgi:hypothetical protein
MPYSEIARAARVRLAQDEVYQAWIPIESPIELRPKALIAILIDDYDLEILEIVAQDACYAVQQHGPAPARRDDDG